MFKVKKDKEKMRVIEDDAKGNAVSSVDTVVFVFRHTHGVITSPTRSK